GQSKNMIAGQINHARLVTAADQGRVPMKPVTRLALWRLGLEPAQLAVTQIDAMHFAALALGVKRVAIVRIEHDIKSVAAGETGPVRITNSFLAQNAARADPVFVVLQSAGNAEVRFVVVERDPIKFARRDT